MNPKTTLRTAGFATLLLCAGPAIALAAGTGTATQPDATSTSSTMTTAAAGTQTHMTESQVKASLKDQGYSDITNLKESNGQYTANAKRYGQEEHNLKIDASTGKVMDQQALDESQVKNLLKDQGYSDISNVKHNGNEFTASAKKNGTEHDVTVDAQSGMVSARAG